MKSQNCVWSRSPLASKQHVSLTDVVFLQDWVPEVLHPELSRLKRFIGSYGVKAGNAMEGAIAAMTSEERPNILGRG